MEVELSQVLFAAFVGGVIYIIFKKMSSNSEGEKYRKCCEQFDYDKQTAAITLEKGGQVRINKETPVTDGKIDYLTSYMDTCKTLYDVFPNGAKLSGM